jgi:hypothetical protein
MRSAVRSAPHPMRLALTLLTALLLGSACAGQPPTTPDLAATLVARCFGPDVPPKVVTRAGDLLFYGDVGPIAFPHLQLPGNPPLQPYRLTGDPAQQFPGSFIPDAYVDPLGAATPFATNFSLIVCNSSATQSHVLHAVTVKITQVVPYTGDVNAWQPLPCSTSYFSTASGVVNEGGCGGADAAALFVSAEFAAQAGRGSVAEAHSAGGGTISLALLPRATSAVSVSARLPQLPGTYTFALGIGADGGGATYGQASHAALYAPITREWDGVSCQDAHMRAQLPTPGSSPTAYYLCPQP